MLKTRRNSPLLPCAAFAIVFGLGTAGHAVADQAIVVAATAPGLTIGQVIEDGAAVRMPEGSNALFLFSSGRTVTVKGPYEGPLDRLSSGKEAQGRLSGLFGAERFAQNELGAARNLRTHQTPRFPASGACGPDTCPPSSGRPIPPSTPRC